MHLFRNVTLAVALAVSADAYAAEAMHSHHGVTGTTIEPGLGTLHHKVSTQSSLAQQFFDQGLKLNYGLNHEAAVQSFQRALELDPNLAMAWWGIALAMGPDINTPMTPEHLAVANEAIAKAAALTQHASKRERAYIAALGKRYSTQEGADQPTLDAAYRDAMVALSAQAPGDVDAAVLAAESLMIPHAWKWWHEDGTPEEGTLDAIAALKRALKLQPDHIGANHYTIHAVEMSLHPEAALPAAHRLEKLAPAAGHLVHMPAHIYMRTGQYLDAARVNELAAHADEHVHVMAGKSDYLPGYHGHNLHFLAVSYLYAGAGSKAMTSAQRLVDLVQAEVERRPDVADYFASNQFLVAVMFDRWGEVLALPQPHTRLPFCTAFYHFARSLALAGSP
jgi:tetratricopeptide (TPR) repeat protein